MACDGDDTDQCANGVTVCTADGTDTECGVETSTDIEEVCGNNVDDDCDSDVDEGCSLTICGTVTVAGSGTPIDGASVTVGGGGLANVIGGAATDALGEYCVTGISPEFVDNGGYFVTAGSEGFLAETQSSGAGDFVFVDQAATVDFELTPIADGPACVEDNFEADTGIWTLSAPVLGSAWTRRQNALLLNEAVGVCVTLPVGEDCAPGPGCPICGANPTPGCLPAVGAIPNAYGGQYAYRFGNEETGNYLSTGGNCAANNGGNGEAVSGTLTSELFTLLTPTEGTTALRFRAWFEIESTDPQKPPTGYDEMVIAIVDDQGLVTSIGSLNPAIDVSGANNEPMTSGGYNMPGVWNLYQFDLSAFHGKTVQVRFSFNSDDGSYNAFRGLLVDNVAVVGAGCAPPKTTLCGTVLGATPTGLVAVAGASVTISGGGPNNVLFGTTSGPSGEYCLEDIPESFIANGGYVALASADGFASASASTPGDFVIVAKETATYDFTLPELGNTTICFEDDFEVDVGDWTPSAAVNDAQWNRRQNGVLVNTATVDGCVVINPEELTCSLNPACGLCAVATDPGCVPQAGSLANAFSGEYAYWFGDLANGNYLGSGSTCTAATGGTGLTVAGDLTSIPVSLPSFAGGTITLQLRSWFEVESVDAQKPPPLGNGFDGMYVEVATDAGVQILGALNPDSDVNGLPSEGLGSGGQYKTPVWNTYEFDLTSFAGQSVSVRLRFDSREGSYNAFRGWMVDDVKIFGEGCAN